MLDESDDASKVVDADHRIERRGGGYMPKGTVLVIGSNATEIEVQGGGTGATGQYLNETN